MGVGRETTASAKGKVYDSAAYAMGVGRETTAWHDVLLSLTTTTKPTRWESVGKPRLVRQRGVITQEPTRWESVGKPRPSNERFANGTEPTRWESVGKPRP